MMREEIWSISLRQAHAFFRTREELSEQTPLLFVAPDCRVMLEELPMDGEGFWQHPRLRLRFSGSEDAVSPLHRAFLIQFLTAGG